MPELSDVILRGLLDRRLPARRGRVEGYIQEAFAARGGRAGEDEITETTMACLLAEEPSLMEEFLRPWIAAETAAVSIEDGHTVDADGRIHPRNRAD